MADFGDIGNNLTLGAGKSVRRNAGDTDFEAFTPGSGTDPNAVHVNAAGEIAAITPKASPVSGDYLIIEDSAAANVKKSITIGDLPGGGGTIGGSSGSTDNAAIRADGTGGATIQSSLVTIDDAGTVNIPTGQEYKINGAQHTHVEADLALTNITTNDASITQHGFMMKYTGDTTKFLRADGSFQTTSGSGGGWDDILATAYLLMGQ